MPERNDVCLGVSGSSSPYRTGTRMLLRSLMGLIVVVGLTQWGSRVSKRTNTLDLCWAICVVNDYQQSMVRTRFIVGCDQAIDGYADDGLLCVEGEEEETEDREKERGRERERDSKSKVNPEVELDNREKRRAKTRLDMQQGGFQYWGRLSSRATCMGFVPC